MLVHVEMQDADKYLRRIGRTSHF